MSKKLFLLPALLLALAIGTMTTSCDKECKTDQNDFTGTYLATENCSISGAGSYSVIISPGAGDTEVLITGIRSGFYATSVRATIDCDNITISSQDPDGDNYIIEGSGFREKDGDRVTITLDFSITGENSSGVVVTNTCNSTSLVRQ